MGGGAIWLQATKYANEETALHCREFLWIPVNSCEFLWIPVNSCISTDQKKSPAHTSPPPARARVVFPAHRCQRTSRVYPMSTSTCDQLFSMCTNSPNLEIWAIPNDLVNSNLIRVLVNTDDQFASLPEWVTFWPVLLSVAMETVYQPNTRNCYF